MFQGSFYSFFQYSRSARSFHYPDGSQFFEYGIYLVLVSALCGDNIGNSLISLLFESLRLFLMTQMKVFISDRDSNKYNTIFRSFKGET